MSTLRKRSREPSSVKIPVSAATRNSSPTHMSEEALTSLPPLPQITGDIILETFTHRSLRFEGAYNADQFSDNERLAELGDKVLQLVATNTVYHRRNPYAKASEIAVCQVSLWFKGTFVHTTFPGRTRKAFETIENRRMGSSLPTSRQVAILTLGYGHLEPGGLSVVLFICDDMTTFHRRDDTYFARTWEASSCSQE